MHAGRGFVSLQFPYTLAIAYCFVCSDNSMYTTHTAFDPHRSTRSSCCCKPHLPRQINAQCISNETAFERPCILTKCKLATSKGLISRFKTVSRSVIADQRMSE